MSPREHAQNRIVEWLDAHTDKFNAPYGIIPGITALHNGGKVREITFGQARYLDATITIWSPTRLIVEARGPASRNIGYEFHSVDALLNALEAM